MIGIIRAGILMTVSPDGIGALAGDNASHVAVVSSSAW